METASFRNLRIGDILKEYKYVTDEQIQTAIAYQKDHKGVRIGGALIALGCITEMQMLEALGKRLGMQVVEISNLDVNPNVVEKIPRQLAERALKPSTSS